MKKIIIDGNNLLHKISSIRELHSYDKEGAAKALTEYVRSRYPSKVRFVFVFDGHGTGSGSSVIYSGYDIADNIIRRMIEDAKDYREICIVSSDAGITGLAKACGCEVIRSEKFAELLIGPGKSPAQGKNVNEIMDKDKPDRSTKKELEEFRRLFS